MQIENGSIPGPCRTHAHWWLLAAWELAQDAKQAAAERREMLSSYSCQIDLYTQSAGFEGDPYVHTFLAVSVTYAGFTVTNTLEASLDGGYLNRLPDPPNIAAGPIPLPTSPKQATNPYTPWPMPRIL